MKYYRVSTNTTHFINISKQPQQAQPQAQAQSKLQLKVFYTNWCGWSKRILSLLESQEFKIAFESVKNKCDLVLVDCEGSGKEECKANNIKGYPTMMLFKNNVPTEYDGPRTTEAIIKYINDN
jgi:hypothetical protein